MIYLVERIHLGLPANRPVKNTRAKVFVTNGSEVPLHGICLLFTRPNPAKELTDITLAQVWYQTSTPPSVDATSNQVIIKCMI